MHKMKLYVKSPDVIYSQGSIQSTYLYQSTKVIKGADRITAYPWNVQLKFLLQMIETRVGVMLVGWGGNNGTTFTAAVYADKMNMMWEGPRGEMKVPNWLGSFTQSSTTYLGLGEDGKEVYIPWTSLVPLLDVKKLEIGGWDISGYNLSDAMGRAHVLDIDLQRKLNDTLKSLIPLPSIYDPTFVASNQQRRADHVIKGSRFEQMNQVYTDMINFKKNRNLDTVIIVWTANTERYCEVLPGVHDTADNLLAAIEHNHPEVSPSTLFAVAAIKAGFPFINGSPQNTIVPGCLELAEQRGVFVAGDDFKSGQTKLKSVLVEFLIGAGIKPMSIVSYNHLGNNDGKNLSAPQQLKSKEISKSNVVDDMVASNPVMYRAGEKPDHCVVIKYLPYVGDSKRAMDEYISEILFGGHNTLAIHNICEDSLLAAPLILDLVVLTEFFGRLEIGAYPIESPCPMHSALSVLGYFLKAPLTTPGTPVINALSKQRACLENLLRASVGLCPVNHMHLEHKVMRPESWDILFEDSS